MKVKIKHKIRIFRHKYTNKIIKAMQYLSVISYGIGHYFEYLTVDFAIYVIAINYVLIISKKK